MLAHPAARIGRDIDWPSMSRVLVVRLDNLGDVVLTGPLLRAVRGALAPGAKLDLLASPGGAAVAPLLPWLDDTATWRASWQDASGRLPQDPEREQELIERLAGYDAVLISTSFSQSPWPMAYAAYLAGVGVRIGQSREFGGSVLSHWVTPDPEDETMHQVDRALRMASLVGIPAQGRHLELAPPPPIALAEDPYVLVAPGASAPARRYDRLADVVERLRADGLRVLVVGTEKEKELVDEVSRGLDGLAGVLDVPQLAGAVAGAAVVVTNNSGCMHLADAYRVPQVVLFAGTEQLSQYAPRAGSATVLNRPTSCTPCRAFECPYNKECLDVAPAQVAAAVWARLDTDGHASAPVVAA